VTGYRSPDTGFAGTPPDAPARAARAADPTPEDNETALNLDQAARRSIQQDLTVLGFSTRGIDGIFGPGTRAAISDWQADEGVTATGFLDPRQIARLRSAAEARGAELAAAAELARREEEAADAALWRSTGANGAASDLRVYLDRYPDGIYAAEARAALDRLQAASREAAAAEDRAAWENAQAQDLAPAYARYLESFPEGTFADQARARIEELDAAPREAALRAEAEAREAELGLNRASRALIEGQLSAVGFDAGDTDGEFDRAARRAIRQFQTRQGLPVTGFIDQATVQALIVASFGAPR
jgi:peptidoglycan hydrolase-like protein with peptidoglycan-binding domain